MVYLASEPFSRFYHANKCSFAFFLSIVVLIALFIFTGFVSFATHEIGLRRYVYMEQPDVTFKNEIVIYNYQDGETLAYSTVPSFNQLQDTLIVSPIITVIVSQLILYSTQNQARSVDSNNDGKVDSFRIKIGFSSSSAELTFSQIYLFFTYELSDIAKIELSDFVKIELSSAGGIEKAKVIGNINFKQREPLSSSTVSQSSYDTGLFDDANQNYNLAELEQDKYSRDQYIVGDYQTVILPALGTGRTEIDIELKVPSKQIIDYEPNILENFKFSWIEFLSVFIPFYIIVTIGLNFLFRNRLFAIQEVNNLVK